MEGCLFPSLGAEVIFNLSFSTIYFGTDKSLQKSPDLEVVGGLSNVMKVSTAEPLRLLGIRFFPHTMKYFLNVEMSALNGTLTAAELIAGSWIRHLQNKLLHLSTLQEKIHCLDDFFPGG